MVLIVIFHLIWKCDKILVQNIMSFFFFSLSHGLIADLFMKCFNVLKTSVSVHTHLNTNIKTFFSHKYYLDIF